MCGLQQVVFSSGEAFATAELPDASEMLREGVAWGRFDQALTPAFWVAQALADGDPPASFRLGDTFAEELAACLLGGHGIPADVGLAAYDRVRPWLPFLGDACPRATLERLLGEPVTVRDRKVLYRFARQRAAYLAGSLAALGDLDHRADDVAFRNQLVRLPGIGMKTASWIVRNWRSSDRVAIIDVHIVRACMMMGIFPAGIVLPRDYLDLEVRFLEFCRKGGIRPAAMDAVMWRTMRQVDARVLGRLIDRDVRQGDYRTRNDEGVEGCQAAAADEVITPQAGARQAEAWRAGAGPAAEARPIHASRPGAGRSTAPSRPSSPSWP